MSVCLESWAILAWLDGDEPALSRVQQLIDSRPVVSWVNLVEVYYRLERDHGRDRADETHTELCASLAPDLPGTARMIDAARLKARASIALAKLFRRDDRRRARTRSAHGDPELLELTEPPCRLEDPRTT